MNKCCTNIGGLPFPAEMRFYVTHEAGHVCFGGESECTSIISLSNDDLFIKFCLQ